ncbi:APC family permease [Sphingomonas soli]|uniref:APC family permease n=1 Tax=Sphingomonas soli TaxID=266127 RepID=UPI00082CF0F0|nr:amino acid permease [Sphingomonas soli]
MEDSRRTFGVWTAAALVVGSMIGSGIFVLPSVVAPLGWTGVAAWVCAIGGAMLLATVLTGLTAHLPGETGIVAIIGKALGPLPSVLCGWSFWVGVWTTNAIIAITAINYLGFFWPPLTATPLNNAGFAVGLLWLLALLNLLGTRAAGRFQVVTTLLKLLPLFAVAAIVLGLLAKGGQAFAANPHTPFSLSALTPAVTMVFLAMIGFETASIAAERVRDPGRNILRATIAGLALTGLLYLIVSTGVSFALPEAAVAESKAPIALFVETFWGPGPAMLLASFAVIATVGCLNGWVLMSGEGPLGMARAGLLPRWMARTNRHDVAAPMLVISTILASILILSSVSQSAGVLLDFMLRLTTAAAMWIYLGGCVAAWKLGLMRPLALAGIAFVLWALWGAGTEALLLSTALILVAIPLYFIALRGPRDAA